MCRFFTYRSTNDHWFMMDFCYWVNFSLIFHQLLCSCSPDGGFCAYWFKLLYIIVSGPISAAVILWGNCLVFHSIDKVQFCESVIFKRDIGFFQQEVIGFRSQVLASTFFLPCWSIWCDGSLLTQARDRPRVPAIPTSQLPYGRDG